MINNEVILIFENFFSFYCREEAQEYIDMGSINSLFVLGRSIGFIGKFEEKKNIEGQMVIFGIIFFRSLYGPKEIEAGIIQTSMG